MVKEEEVIQALASNDLEKLEELMEEGFDINHQFESSKLVSFGYSEHFESENLNTLLHFAVLIGTEEMIEFLLERGINPGIRNKWNQTAMELQDGKDENIDFLMIKIQSMYF
eukprot:gene5731-9554_t